MNASAPSAVLMGLMQDRPLLISSLLEYARTYHPAREIVTRTVEGPLHRTNYAQLAGRAAQVADALRQFGIGAGDRVATLGWNTYRHLEVFFAVSGLGAVLHTVNPRLFEQQIEYILAHGGARVVFADATFLPLLARLKSALPAVELVIPFGGEDPAHLEALAPTLPYEAFLARGRTTFVWPEFDERSASSLCYTSGTTGQPKGVLYSHRSTVLHSLAVAQKGAMNLGCDDTIIAIAPMYHANAWGMPYVAAMVGARLLLPGPRHDADSIISLLNEERATFACGVPTVWTGVLERLADTGQTLTTLQRTTIGGSAVSQAMIEGLAKHGVRVLQLWGMTETSPLGVVATDTPEIAALDEASAQRQRRKQGRAQYGIELKIVDAQGGVLPHDGRTPGALWVRGPWVAKAYYQHAATLLDAEGWFPTGDVATIDPAGYLQITDREKDMIKSGGEWISSIELENAAAGHPDVSLVAVIGIAHPKWEERPLMIVQCAQGRSLTHESMAAWLESRVARWWIPERVELIEQMPLTATGKIRKTELRSRYAVAPT
jgi:fatty-acyl-CoA synthase